MRLDKLLSGQGSLSRSQAKGLVRSGQVTVNGEVERSPERKIEPRDQVCLRGEPVVRTGPVYLMLNKPSGVVCATKDIRERTVLELVPPALFRKGLFPAGRLDKDTEGFVLLTDDGDFAHRMLAPRRHVPKTYYAELDGPVDATLAAAFAQGVGLDGGDRTSPAQLTILPPGDRVELVIYEGMYHQVKRMFAAFGRRVCYLKRTRIGGLELDKSLPLGGCREIFDKERELIC